MPGGGGDIGAGGGGGGGSGGGEGSGSGGDDGAVQDDVAVPPPLLAMASAGMTCRLLLRHLWHTRWKVTVTASAQDVHPF